MDGIIKIDSKPIAVPLLKTKSPESISLVMDTFVKIAMTSQLLLFVYGFAHTSVRQGLISQASRDNNGRFQSIRYCTNNTATVLEKHHRIDPEDFTDIFKECLQSFVAKQSLKIVL